MKSDWRVSHDLTMMLRGLENTSNLKTPEKEMERLAGGDEIVYDGQTADEFIEKGMKSLGDTFNGYENPSSVCMTRNMIERLYWLMKGSKTDLIRLTTDSGSEPSLIYAEFMEKGSVHDLNGEAVIAPGVNDYIMKNAAAFPFMEDRGR